jgi:hypothetical protein
MIREQQPRRQDGRKQGIWRDFMVPIYYHKRYTAWHERNPECRVSELGSGFLLAWPNQSWKCSNRCETPHLLLCCNHRCLHFTVEARNKYQARPWGIYVGQSDTGAAFLRVFGFFINVPYWHFMYFPSTMSILADDSVIRWNTFLLKLIRRTIQSLFYMTKNTTATHPVTEMSTRNISWGGGGPWGVKVAGA